MDDCHCSRPFIIEAKSMIFSVGPKPSSLPAVGYSFELAQLAIMIFLYCFKFTPLANTGCSRLFDTI